MSAICGGRQPLSKKKPKDWIDRGYTILAPFKFKWRVTIGKLTCDCKQVIENYQPWYGFTIYHSDECVLMQRVRAKPWLENLPCYYNVAVIGQSG